MKEIYKGKLSILKKEKGITLLSLVVTVVVMLILTFTISINVDTYVERKVKTNFDTDILRLQEQVEQYYSINKTLPIINKYTNTSMLEKNVNDNSNYYVIDLSKLDVNLNYGADYNTITDKTVEINNLFDIYIINEQSHVIYYPKGIRYNGKIYYTSTNTANTKIQDLPISGIQIEGEKIGKVGESIQLTIKTTPSFVENTGVIWSIDDETLATVDGNGTVTLKAGGTVTITATLKDDTTIKSSYQIQISKSQIELLIEQKKYMTENTKVKDSNGNIITVPEGFKIAEDSGINVTEGIVIEDNDIKEGIGNNRGNQYVWIPVGTGIKKSDNTTVNITLGRYIFADGTNHKDTNGNLLEKGTPILKQNADNYADETEISYKEVNPTETSDYVFKELKTSRIGVASSGTDGLNTTAIGKQKEDGTYEGINSFIDSVKANGGYYIARYEASYGTDGKANSKISNSYSGTTAPTTEGTLWNFITQINAATASRNLYTKLNSDLINSYAWDTAIVYIQNFSGDIYYSRQDGKSINSSLTNTGVNGDEVCKINDMASNIVEWTTEYCTATNNPCNNRGGLYKYNGGYTSERGNNYATQRVEHYTFRYILYM